jgi:hypothetical protein
MYIYLKKRIHEAAKEALGGKEVKKEKKTMFWDAEIKRKTK